MPWVAILMLSVADDHEPNAEALDAGADHCVRKPFHVGELTSRIRATLRKSRRATTGCSEEFIAIGDVEIHLARRPILKSGEVVHLTSRNSTFFVLGSYRFLPIPGRDSRLETPTALHGSGSLFVLAGLSPSP